MKSYLNKATALALDLIDSFSNSGVHRYYDIAGIHSNKTFITNDLSYLTLIEVDGYKGQLTIEQLTNLSDSLSLFFSKFLSEGKHSFKIFYEKNCEEMQSELESGYRTARNTAKQFGLDIDFLIDESISVNKKGSFTEKIFFALYTTNFKSDFDDPQDITKIFSSSQSIHRNKSQLVRHESMVRLVEDRLSENLYARSLDAYDFLKRQYDIIHGYTNSDKKLRVETVTQRKALELNANHKSQYSLFKESAGRLPRFIRDSLNTSRVSEMLKAATLGEQMLDESIRHHDSDVIVVGSRIYKPLAITSFGMSINSFNYLVRKAEGISFRAAYTITANKNQTNIVGKTLMLFTAGMGDNALREEAEKKLNEIRDQACGLSIVFSVYERVKSYYDHDAKKEVISTSSIMSKYEQLKSTLGLWAELTATSARGDCAELVFSTIPGLLRHHVVEKDTAPLSDVFKISPIIRPATIWNEGSLLLRTPEGKIFFEKPMDTSRVASEIITVVGGLGYAKSSISTARDFAFLTSMNTTTSPPILRGIDFGHSKVGIVDLVRSSFGPDKAHLAQHIQVQQTPDYAYNFFDLQLGNRKPIHSHQERAAAFVELLTESLSSYPSHEGLCVAVVKEAYNFYSDVDGNPNAKAYYQGASHEIDEYLLRQDINVGDFGGTWYGLMDYLFERGQHNLASLAQRYAVPIVPDLISIASSSVIRSQYPDYVDGVAVTELFSRAITEAIDAIPIISAPSVITASQSPIIYLDLQDVIHNDASTQSIRRKNGIVYTLMSEMLLSDLFADEREIEQYNEAYKEYHLKRLNTISSVPKRFSADETNKIADIEAAMKMLDIVTFHCRKYGLGIMFSSQVPESLPRAAVKVATIRVFAGGLPTKVLVDPKYFDLPENVAELVARLPKPSAANGASYLTQYALGESDENAYFNLETVVKIGPSMLWAMATYQEDRAMIKIMGQMLGSTAKAFKILGKHYPTGEIRSELRRITQQRDQGLYHSTTGNFIKDLAISILEQEGYSTRGYL